MKSRIKDAEGQINSDTRPLHVSDDEMLTASFKDCSLDATTVQLAEFERQYSDQKRVHDEDVSFFMSKLESFFALSPIGEHFEELVHDVQQSNRNELTVEENQCIHMCINIMSCADRVMEEFDEQCGHDGMSSIKMKSVAIQIEEERSSLNADIRELRATNSEQANSLQNGFLMIDRAWKQQHSGIKDVSVRRSNQQLVIESASFSTKAKENPFLKLEKLELEGEKARITKAIHDIARKKTLFKKNSYVAKENTRKTSQQSRSELRSLELRELDARQKSCHLEEANCKLDDVCKTLARTIDTTKRHQVSRSELAEFSLNERLSV